MAEEFLVNQSVAIMLLEEAGFKAYRHSHNSGNLVVEWAGLTIPLLLDSDNALLDSSLGYKTGPQFEFSDPNFTDKLKQWFEAGGPEDWKP